MVGVQNVERNVDAPVLFANVFHRGDAGEAWLILKPLIGLDDSFNMVVSQKALGAFAGEFVNGVDEKDFSPPRLWLACTAEDHARLHWRVVEKVRAEAE